MNIRNERKLVLRDHFNPGVESRNTNRSQYTQLVLELMAASNAQTGKLGRTERKQIRTSWGRGVGYDWKKAFNEVEINELLNRAIKGECVTIEEWVTEEGSITREEVLDRFFSRPLNRKELDEVLLELSAHIERSDYYKQNGTALSALPLKRARLKRALKRSPHWSEFSGEELCLLSLAALSGQTMTAAKLRVLATAAPVLLPVLLSVVTAQK